MSLPSLVKEARAKGESKPVKDEKLLERITVNPRVMVGKPVIRGTRIPVALILKMLGQGIPTEEVLREYPRLKKVDIEAAIAYAARVIEHEDVFPLSMQGEWAPA